MEVHQIIAEINNQIAKLQQARHLLSGAETEPARRRPGRPKGSKNSLKPLASKTANGRKLSPESRERIADAMKRRWAQRNGSPAKTASAK